jgi:hypothetical protein
MNLQKSILKQFDKMRSRGWDKIFWAIDLHDTIMPGTYTSDDDDEAFFKGAVEALQTLTNRMDCSLILWTSSHKSYAQKHLDRLEALGIKFDYFNENPDCENTKLCDFTGKFYFNVILDDKAGFDGTSDWYKIQKTLDSL